MSKTCDLLCEHAGEGMYVGTVFCGLDGEEREFESECPHGDKCQVDMVNHPPHYTSGGIECIDAIQAAVTGKPPYEAWLTGQIIKYVWRYNFKNGKEDLEKAEFYLKRLIDIQE